MDRYDDSWRGMPGRSPWRPGPDQWPPAQRGRSRRYGYDVDLGRSRYRGDFRGYVPRYDQLLRPAESRWSRPYRPDGYDRAFRGESRPYNRGAYGGYPPEAYDSMRREAPAAQHDLAAADDGWISEAVRHSLLQDGYLDAGAIEVEVNAGVVTLRGEVQDYMQARYAWDDAWDAPGVVGVVNRLAVAEAQSNAKESGERAERRG